MTAVRLEDLTLEQRLDIMLFGNTVTYTDPDGVQHRISPLILWDRELPLPPRKSPEEKEPAFTDQPKPEQPF